MLILTHILPLAVTRLLHHDGGWRQLRLRGVGRRLNWSFLLSGLLALAAGAQEREDDGRGTATTATAVDSTKRVAVQTLAAQWSERLLDLHPLSATRLGIPGRDHLLPPPLTTPQVEALALEYEAQIAALDRIGRPALDAEAQLEFDALRWEVASQLELLRFPGHLLAVSRFGGSALFELVQLISPHGAQPLDTLADFETWDERLGALPAWIAVAMDNLREGLQRGVVLSRPVAQSTYRQLDAILTSAQRPLERPLRLLEERGFDGDAARTLSQRLDRTTASAARSVARLRDFLRTSYLPKARPGISWQELPEGDAWYRALVRRSTTVDTTPEELLQFGVLEVQRIIDEMGQLARQLGYESVVALYDAVDEATLQAVAPERVLGEFARVEQVVRRQLPTFFPRLPTSALEVQRVTGAEAIWGPGNVYRAPSVDGRVPGVFYAHIGARYPLSTVDALFLHEGLPGHHFQIALALESDLPMYRRTSPWTAFVEGWGLYAESLGAQLGLYTDPMQRAGRLSMELLRAARLVLDTGIHAGGWTFEQAQRQARVQLLGSGESEVLRYAGMPAQALGYKVGERRFLEIRRLAEARLGREFDQRAFHGAVLEAGPLPLDLLEREVLRRLDIATVD